MGPSKYYIETFGCQMNQRDSQTIAGLLSETGLEPTCDPQNARVIVLNTCAVRDGAERKAWSRLGRLFSMAKEDPIFVLSGCMAQLPETMKRVKARFPYVKIITGPGQIDKIPELVQKVLDERRGKTLSKGPLVAISPARVGSEREETRQVLPEGLPRALAPGVTAFVNIMYGCDNFCTYCIVPYVRGAQASRDPRRVINEVESLVQRGYKEVTLLGQNVNAYGVDLQGGYDFADLLKDLDETPRLLRIRYFTSHPKDFTRKMVDVVRDSKHVCEHFHLPLQSGSDRILKLMNRGYISQQYLDLCRYIKEEIPSASITTDIIVGFPGEEEEDFQKTLDIVRAVRFDGVFTFIFSPRKGTAAAKMEKAVPDQIKTKRLEVLVDVQGKITKEENQKLLGSTQEILIEGPDPKHMGLMAGRTRTNKMVLIPNEKVEPGALVLAKIEEAGTWYLKGSLA